MRLTHEYRVSGECQQLLTLAASQIVDNFLASPVAKWTAVGLDSVPAMVEVDCPALTGNTLDVVDPACRNGSQHFEQLLNATIADYLKGIATKAKPGAIQVEHIASDYGVCTGKVTAFDASMGWCQPPRLAPQAT